MTRSPNPGVAITKKFLLLWTVGLLALPCRANVNETALSPLDRVTGEYDAFVYTDSIESPDELAIHPQTREIYVSERKTGRIFVVRNGERVPVIDQGWYVVDNLPNWAVSPGRPKGYWLHNRLRNPEGLGFSNEGHLFVAEEVADGRLLEFIPNAEGRFEEARVIPVPWANKSYAWEGISLASDGRLFLAGSAAESGPSLFFGVVLMRDVVGDWWVIDYGPFAGFSSVSLSREEDILVVSEGVTGSVTWWDAIRHRAIGTVSRNFPDIKSARVLPDGAILVAEVREGQAGEDAVARLLRVDPKNGETRVVASGLHAIDAVEVDPRTGYIYVTEMNQDLVLELRPQEPVIREPYILENTVRIYELANGVPPKKWPPYLKGFFKDLGVTPRDEVSRKGEQGHEKGDVNSYTLLEVGKAVPLIAGQVHTEPSYRVEQEDPIIDIHFLVLFPNRSVHTPEDSAPGLSFFSVKRLSGKTERTHSLEHLQSYRFNVEAGWRLQSKNATMYLPNTGCSVTSTDKGMDITLAFISPSAGDDYYLQLHCGAENTGSLTVDNHKGSRSYYGVNFEEDVMDGAAYNSVVVAGFGKEEDEAPGWLNIGNWPLAYAVNPGQQVDWVPYTANQRFPFHDLFAGEPGDDVEPGSKKPGRQ